MAKKRKRKHWWKNIKFKYRLSVLNENTLDEVFTLYVSKLNGLSLLLTTLFFLFLFTALLMVYTPLRNYLPGYMSNQLRATIVDNTLMLDSLERVVERQRSYITSIQNILAGNIRVDTVSSLDSLSVFQVPELIPASQREEEFRVQFEEDERFNLTTSIAMKSDTDGLEFYCPTRGILSLSYDPDVPHYGVDVAANPNESVLATLEGTVIWSSYSTKDGYVIALQHGRGMVSIYKHCGSLLKKEGDHVAAGEAIALVGKWGTHTAGPHLHFELWYKGHPLNPERYIIF